MDAVFLYFFVTALGHFFCNDQNCVCGDDGITYSWIVAKWKGMPLDCKGPCPCEERCPTTEAPVCGKDGKTYPNKCVAGNGNVKCAGKCPCAPQPCSLNPVCGKDGQTYDNDCLAEEVGVECENPCPCKPKACPRHYRPVCGVNGKTYANDCVAGDEKIACRSKCPCCASDFFPICAADGQTHRNYCAAQQAGLVGKSDEFHAASSVLRRMPLWKGVSGVLQGNTTCLWLRLCVLCQRMRRSTTRRPYCMRGIVSMYEGCDDKLPLLAEAQRSRRGSRSCVGSGGGFA